MMVLGAIGPWATAFGVLSVSGTDGDGVIVLLAGLVVGAMVWLWYVRRARHLMLIVAVLAAGAAAATSIHDMVSIQSAISGSHGIVSIGWGLWLDCIASIGAILALVVMLRAALTDEGVTRVTRLPQAHSLAEAPQSASPDGPHQTVATDRPDAAVLPMGDSEAVSSLEIVDEAKPTFCEQCGQRLRLTAKFCGTCGHPVSVQAVGSPEGGRRME
jgi:hypothetical protein